ncbi:MAG: hypothetical protein Q7K39_03910 [Candidatus Magasanikbacteria bacterium]|nr:hypothetical protein [Candidatus Magasanikbacteria bacterium]
MVREIDRGGEFHGGLIEKAYLDEKLCFGLPAERDTEGHEVANVEWLKLEWGGQRVEGKLYRPADKNTDSLIIWTPGLPGDGTTWFEEKHVPALVAEGYTVMALRHRGTRTKTEKAENYVHCPERQAKPAETLGEDRVVSMDDLAFEPAIALNVLGPKFFTVKLIGHSAGAPFSLHSLRHAPTVVGKITNIVSLAGAVGGEGHFADSFPPFEEYMKYCQTRINIGDPKANMEAFYRIVEEIYQREIEIPVRARGKLPEIPEHIMMTLVHGEGDEYLKASGEERLFTHLNRGLNINDKTQFEPEIHDLKNLRPETLLRLLAMHYPKAKHRATVSAREPRQK